MSYRVRVDSARMYLLHISAEQVHLGPQSQALLFETIQEAQAHQDLLSRRLPKELISLERHEPKFRLCHVTLGYFTGKPSTPWSFKPDEALVYNRDLDAIPARGYLVASFPGFLTSSFTIERIES